MVSVRHLGIKVLGCHRDTWVCESGNISEFCHIFVNSITKKNKKNEKKIHFLCLF